MSGPGVLRAPAADAALAGRVQAIRGFNRFYTGRIGILRERLVNSDYSLTEVRVLYALAHREELTATGLVAELGLDPGYLSRLLRNLQDQGLVEKHRSGTDGRQSMLRLSPAGRAALLPLEKRTEEELMALLAPLSDGDQQALCGAMSMIRHLLGPGDAGQPQFMLRTHRPGDIGWMIHRHAVLYAREYHWNEQFEALVAGIGARFIERFDARFERCWIAERNGQIAGGVFVARRSASVAQLRMMYVEPQARGLGIGRRLVDECIRFAREAGYRRMELWTNRVLVSARRIYQAAGFEPVKSEPHHSFGHDLVGETWRLKL